MYKPILVHDPTGLLAMSNSGEGCDHVLEGISRGKKMARGPAVVASGKRYCGSASADPAALTHGATIIFSLSDCVWSFLIDVFSSESAQFFEGPWCRASGRNAQSERQEAAAALSQLLLQVFSCSPWILCTSSCTACARASSWAPSKPALSFCSAIVSSSAMVSSLPERFLLSLLIDTIIEILGRRERGGTRDDAYRSGLCIQAPSLCMRALFLLSLLIDIIIKILGRARERDNDSSFDLSEWWKH